MPTRRACAPLKSSASCRLMYLQNTCQVLCVSIASSRRVCNLSSKEISDSVAKVASSFQSLITLTEFKTKSNLRFRTPIAFVEVNLFARLGRRSSWIRRRFHQRLKLAMVDLAGAQLGNLLHDFYLARDAQIRQPLGFDGVAYFVQGQLRFVGHGDEHFAFVFIGAREDGDLTAQTVVRKRSRQGVLDRREAHHLATHLGEAFHPPADVQVA